MIGKMTKDSTPSTDKRNPAPAGAGRPRRSRTVELTKAEARRVWLRAQRLDVDEPFGNGPEATPTAVKHLGYVQIDTINVIERSHHHILWNRIPGYRREHLHQAQSVDRSVFEYWTHALSYVPTIDLRFFLSEMKRHRLSPNQWFASVTKKDLAKVMKLVRDGGALTIREIDDDVLVEKDHAWASRKPSKRALQLAFHSGALTISGRTGMLKTYELPDRHFGWESRPRPASEGQVLDYLVDRSLRSQGIVSLDSICHLDARRKAAIRGTIESRMRRRTLLPVAIEGAGKVEHWIEPAMLDTAPVQAGERLHILSPFDPLVIQRKRLRFFFDYEHRFEAYVPKEKRVLGYFALPVLDGDRIVAAIDLKTDRTKRRLLVQQWTWLDEAAASRKALIEEALHRFERFQLASLSNADMNP